MAAYRAVIMRCDFPGCKRKTVVKVTTTAGGSHQARAFVTNQGWTCDLTDGDICFSHIL